MNFPQRYIIVAGLVFAMLELGAAHTANAVLVIDHGDFSGNTVEYLNVAENANSPGDVGEYLRAPTLIGDTLDFDPAGFSTTALDNIVLLDVQLNFIVASKTENGISHLRLSESGDYSLIGMGMTPVAEVNYSMSIASVTALEVDGIELDSPVDLDMAVAFGSDDISGGVERGTPWSLGIVYDIDAALTEAGIAYTQGATKLEFTIDDTLSSLAGPMSFAFIAKKNFRVEAVTAVPECSSFALLSMVACVGFMLRSRVLWSRSKANSDA